MQVTTTIPIVFAIAVDPLGAGMVASLAKPGGNVTGLSTQTIELPGKRIELLRAVLPDLRRLAVLANVNYPAAVHEAEQVQAVARKLDIEIEMLEVGAPRTSCLPSRNSTVGYRPSMYALTR